MIEGAPLAHGVGRVFESPIPLSLYLVGSAATVVASFAIRALARSDEPLRSPRTVAGRAPARALATALKAAAIVGLVLTIAAGVAVAERGVTLASLLFWIGLVVGMVFVSLVLGGAWDAAAPWAAMEDALRVEEAEARSAPPWWLGPALLFLLFWFELVSEVGFDSFWVLVALLAYSVFALVFRGRFGERFGEADPLRILFGFAARSSPLRLRRDAIDYVGPLYGLDEDRGMPRNLHVALFVLLGATTLDNVIETVGWTSFLSRPGIEVLPRMAVETVALAACALLFWGPFMTTMYFANRWAAPGSNLWELARRFSWSLIPIGIAYLLAHNAPLLMIGIPQLLRGLSDPLAADWNLLGTARLWEGFAPSPVLVWWISIVVIVGGHILAVLAAHRTALKLAVDRSGAVKSQYALTGLMALFTIATLWLLSQPLVA